MRMNEEAIPFTGRPGTSVNAPGARVSVLCDGANFKFPDTLPAARTFGG